MKWLSTILLLFCFLQPHLCYDFSNLKLFNINRVAGVQIVENEFATLGKVAPESIYLDEANDILYFTDPTSIRKLFLDNLTVATTVGCATTTCFISNIDNTPAIQSYLFSPTHVTLSPVTNELYLCDEGFKRVRKVGSSNGRLQITAGGGTTLNEGGLATAADVAPRKLQVTMDNEMFITIRNSQRIRKVFENGTIVTVVGTGVGGFSGDFGPAIAAQLSYPKDAYYFENRLYIADTENSRIRVVYENGTIQTLLQYVNKPNSIIIKALQTNQQTYMYWTEQCRVKRMHLQNGTIETLAGISSYSVRDSGDGNIATQAELNQPTYATVSSKTGDVYIATASKIRKIDASTGIISTIAGITINDQLSHFSPLNKPSDVAICPITGEIYLADYSDHVIRKVLHNDTIITVAGTKGASGATGDYGPATNALLSGPRSISFSPQGDLYISLFYHRTIRKIFANGTIVTLASTPQLNQPRGIFYGNNQLFIADSGLDCVKSLYTLSNGSVALDTVAGRCGVSGSGGDKGEATKATLNNPIDVVYDAMNNQLYILQENNGIIRIVYANGMIDTFVTISLAGYVSSIALDASQSLIISTIGSTYDTYLYRIGSNNRALPLAGSTTGYSGDKGSLIEHARFWSPEGIDTSLPDGTVLLADVSNQVIRAFKICPQGIRIGSNNNFICRLCSPGQGANYAQSSCVTCNPGYVSADGSVCRKCPAGTSSNATNTGCVPCKNDEIADPGSSSCTKCSTGTVPNSYKVTCISGCSVGYFLNTTSNQCDACPAGSSSNAASTACISCSNGYVAPTSGSACVPCSAGTTSNLFKTNCTRCMDGYFSPAQGTTCNACAAGKTNNPTYTNCDNCMNGYYAPVSGSVCMPCPQGYTSNPLKIDCILMPLNSSQTNPQSSTTTPDAVSHANSISLYVFLYVLMATIIL